VTAAVDTRRVGPAGVEVLPPERSGHDSEEWHEARRAGIGSSDIAALLGLSRWESPYSIWQQKAAGLGWQDETERMRWGRRLEAAIASEFAERHPEFFCGGAGLIRNADRDYQLATPDRLLWNEQPPAFYIQEGVDVIGVLECKTDESWDEWGPDGSADIPLKYRAQAIWQADTLGLPGVHVAALLPGKRYREYYVAHDPADAAVMRDAAEAFMASLAEGVPPDLDGSEATHRALQAVYSEVDDSEVTVGKRLAKQWRSACQAYGVARRRKALAESRIRAALGSAKTAVDPAGVKVAYRVRYERAGYTVGPALVDSIRAAKEPTP